MKVLLLSLALGAPLATPISDTVPTWNVQASCKGTIEADKASNLADAQTYDACLRDEMEARNELVKVWTTYSTVIRSRCEQEASGPGPASYVDLIVCMQITADAEPKLNNQTKPTPSSSVHALKGAGKHRLKSAKN